MNTLTPKQIEQFVHNSINLIARTELQIQTAEYGTCSLTMPLGPNSNHIGSMYAAALFTLAEVTGGILCVTTFDNSKYYPIVKDVEIKFLKPATTDIHVTQTLNKHEIERIEQEAAAHGKAEYVLNCSLVDDHGTTVAVTTNVYQIRSL